jgi:predicted component of type VI protein secretion system
LRTARSVEHVRACLRYYADFQHEIDEWTARAQAIEAREEKNWRRQQELLT